MAMLPPSSLAIISMVNDVSIPTTRAKTAVMNSHTTIQICIDALASIALLTKYDKNLPNVNAVKSHG